MKLIECPRDAMQGIKEFIPTELKIKYINQLMKVGFDTLDCGSYVSPKVIPQMQDTEFVLNSIEKTQTKVSVIVASISGAERAIKNKIVDYLAFPFSISETFQLRNTNSTRIQSLEHIKIIQNKLQNTDKKLIVYLSMAFGNPYNDDWSVEEVLRWTEEIAKQGIEIMNISDTTGIATLEQIDNVFTALNQHFPQIEFGAHLHTKNNDWKPKIELLYQLNCQRFDSAIKGFGGCPLAEDKLVGNFPTEKLISFFNEKKVANNINILAFESAYNLAKDIFENYH